MTAEAAYQFIKPVFEQMQPGEKEKLIALMQGQNNPIRKFRKKKIDPVPTVADYKRMLARTIFKNS